MVPQFSWRFREILPRLCLGCRFQLLSFGGSVLGFHRASGHRCKHKRRVYLRDANLGAGVQSVRRRNSCVACTAIWTVKTAANGVISDGGHHGWCWRGKVDTATFVFSVFSFSFFWIFVDVFQLGTLSNIDHSGRYAAMVPRLPGRGAGHGLLRSRERMLSYQLGYSSVMLMCALASGAALFIYLRVYQVLLRLDPRIWRMPIRLTKGGI